MSVDNVFQWLINQGPTGMALAALVWVQLQRDKDRYQCEAEKKALNDAHLAELRATNQESKTESKETTRALIELNKQVLSAIESLDKIAGSRRQ